MEAGRLLIPHGFPRVRPAGNAPAVRGQAYNRTKTDGENTPVTTRPFPNLLLPLRLGTLPVMNKCLLRRRLSFSCC